MTLRIHPQILKTFFFFSGTVLFTTFCLGQTNQISSNTNGPETVSFFDGSSLMGGLKEIKDGGELIWNHKSSQNPLKFDYKAVESILFNRIENKKRDSGGSMIILFKNNNFLRGSIHSLNAEKLVFSSGFGQSLEANLSQIRSLEFLPESYQVLYDSSYDFEQWKKSNTKAWTEEQGSLVSVFSGSTGTILPDLDAIEVSFQAEWQRSFYLALRFFSDSDGGSYGSEGFHLSFSNNRINLQSNRKVKGRTIRETLGSVMVDQLVGVKTANFKIYAHRQRKEFIVFVNGNEVAKWKDSSTDYLPENSGLLFINQGGNSYLRMEELTIAGWSGEYFLTSPPSELEQDGTQFISFKNGDSTSLQSSSSTDNGLSIKTKRGIFEVPYANIKSIYFPNDDLNQSNLTFNEEVSFKSSMGKLSFKLNSIQNNLLLGKHPYLGDLRIPLQLVKRLRCNLLLKSYKEYLSQLKLAEESLKSQNSEKALSILENTNPRYQCWYWKRLKFLAHDSQTKEILWFTPHPDVGILQATFSEEAGETIFTTSREGSFALWDEYAKLAEGNYTHKHSTSQELGRFKNEKWKKIFISNCYWLGRTEVTQEQFEKVTGTNPSKKKGPNLPVQVSWFESMEFCKLMNKKYPPPGGFTWRLPTEAEWEYAARAGSSGPYSDTFYGEFPNKQNAYEEHLKQYGWFSENSLGEVKAVSQKLPNGWGLFDMHGNVWEWCIDGTKVNKSELFSFPRAGSKNPVKLNGDWKVLRGGSFITDSLCCRSSYRGANAPTISEGDRGLRICLGQVLSSNESNTSKIKRQKENLDKQVQEFSPIPLQRIDPGEFMMGSRNSTSFPQAICDLKDKNILSTDLSGKVRSQNIASNIPECELDLNGTGLVITPLSTKNYVLIGTDNGKVHLINKSTKRIISTYSDHLGPISHIAINNSQQIFVTCGTGGRIALRKIGSEKPIWVLKTEDYKSDIEYVEFSHDSKTLLASGLNSDVITIDVKSGKFNTVWSKDKGLVLKAKWLPEKNYFSILHPNGILSFLEYKSGIIYKIIRSNLPSACDFEFSKDGKRILFITEKGSCSLRELPVAESILIIRPDGKLEQTPDFYFNLSKLKNEKSLELENFLLKHQDKVSFKESVFLSNSPCDQQIATTHDGALRIWSKKYGFLLATIAEKLSSDFQACGFSEDGKSLIGKLESGHIVVYPTDLSDLNNLNFARLCKESFNH